MVNLRTLKELKWETRQNWVRSHHFLLYFLLRCLKAYFWWEDWIPRLCLKTTLEFLWYYLIVRQLVRKVLHKVSYTRNQVPPYLWRGKPKWKCCFVSLYYFRHRTSGIFQKLYTVKPTNSGHVLNSGQNI